MKFTTVACFVLFLLAVVAGLMQLWMNYWSPANFIKVLITDGALFSVVFTLAFLVREKLGVNSIENLRPIICFALFLAGVVIALVQLWAEYWSPVMFSKIIMTDGALFIIAFAFAFLMRESRESDMLDKNKLE